MTEKEELLKKILHKEIQIREILLKENITVKRTMELEHQIDLLNELLTTVESHPGSILCSHSGVRAPQ